MSGPLTSDETIWGDNLDTWLGNSSDDDWEETQWCWDGKLTLIQINPPFGGSEIKSWSPDRTSVWPSVEVTPTRGWIVCPRATESYQGLPVWHGEPPGRASKHAQEKWRWADLIERWEDDRNTETWVDDRKKRLRMQLRAEDRELQRSFIEKNRIRNKEEWKCAYAPKHPCCVTQKNALRLMDRKKNETEKYHRKVEKEKLVHWIFYTVNFTFTIINSGFIRD